MNRIFLFLREIRVEITVITNVMGILIEARERYLFETATTVLLSGQ